MLIQGNHSSSGEREGEMQSLETEDQVLPTVRRDIPCSENVEKGDL